MHLDSVLARSGALGCFQLVSNFAELGLEVQSGRNAVTDADLKVAEGALRDYRAPLDLSRIVTVSPLKWYR